MPENPQWLSLSHLIFFVTIFAQKAAGIENIPWDFTVTGKFTLMIKTKCVFRYMALNWSNLSQIISRKLDHWGTWVWFLHYPPWNVQKWFTLAPVCLQTTSHGSLHPPSLPLPQWLLFLSCQHRSQIINILTSWEGLWWFSGKWIGSAFLNSLTAEGWQRD